MVDLLLLCCYYQKKRYFLLAIVFMSLCLLGLNNYVSHRFIKRFFFKFSKLNYLSLNMIWAMEEEDDSKFNCSWHQSQVNWTSCNGCLRPKVADFENGSFYEVDEHDDYASNYTGDYFRIQQDVVEGFITDYLIEPDLNSSSVFLLAVQPSILDRGYERDVVRSTWGSVARQQTWPYRAVNAHVKIIFVVARQFIDESRNDTRNASKMFEDITKEAELYNDILFLDMTDSYWNLTLKMLSAFKWVKDNCPCVKFVLKVDYDTFVNVPLLVDTLLYYENRFQNGILGGVYFSNPTKRWGRWAVPFQLYPLNRYAHHASGCGYVLSNKALRGIIRVAPHFRMFSNEDAFITGVLRRAIGCPLFNFPHLFTYQHQRYWYRCLMLQDNKILGSSRSGGHRHYMVWGTFGSQKCK